MDPVSGEPVETDGIYENEWGWETQLNRGEIFPADPELGTTVWKLVALSGDTHSGLAPDPRYKEEITYPDRFKDKRTDKGD
jgi:hypothetical protein